MSMPLIFISYPRNERELAHLLVNAFTEYGWEVWLDVDNGPGGDWRKQIENAIELASDVLVVMSSDSIKSEMVGYEVSLALEKKRNIVPVMVEGFQWPSQETAPDWVNAVQAFNGVPVSYHYREAFIQKLISYCKEARSFEKYTQRRPWWRFW